MYVHSDWGFALTAISFSEQTMMTHSTAYQMLSGQHTWVWWRAWLWPARRFGRLLLLAKELGLVGYIEICSVYNGP